MNPLKFLVTFTFFFIVNSQSSPVVNNIDWQAYLSRHDPIWNSSISSCYTGYTLLNDTIKHEGVSSCSAIQCSSPGPACIEASASACDACNECTSFGLSSIWHNGTLAQLFGNVTAYLPNSDWNTYVKGGPILQNHSGCSVKNAPTAWEDGLWLGNGQQGSILLWDTTNPRAMRLEVGRVDIWDRRAPGSKFATGAVMFDRPRLPVGYFSLNTSGVINHAEFRLHLSEGVARGRIETSLGSIDFLLASLVSPREHHLLQFNATGGEIPNGTSSGFSIDFFPVLGDSTRQNPPASYLPNPAPNCTGFGNGTNVRVCSQSLLAGAGYATAFTTAPLVGVPGAFVSIFHTANDWPENTSTGTAETLVEDAVGILTQPGGLDAALADQSSWWLSYFKTSFVSIPNTALEGVYVLQMAKVAAATRAGGVALDLMGPWWQRSGWELYWWDMNVPVTYWALYAAARFDLAATLTNFLLSNVTQLAANPSVHDAYGMGGVSSYDLVSPYNVTPGAMLGNFPWIMHNLYSHASFTGNYTMLREVVFPLLKGAVNVYKAFSFIGEDGLIHLPASYSPEYPYPSGPTNDTHYDLALFFWGAKTLIQLNTQFSLNDPLLPYWQSVLATLTPYPTDINHGYNVSLGVGFNVLHRHFSHLFALFPLHNVVWDDKDGGSQASRDVFEKSLDRWTSLTCLSSTSKCPNGFTFDGAISLSALMTTNMSRREDAAAYANGFVHSGLLHASTLYSEGHQPCLESPLGLASGLQDILIQSWGGRLRVFPAAPPSWPDAVFYNLAAEGGFRVSAVRANGTTSFVALTAAPVDIDGATVVTATLSVEISGKIAWIPTDANVVSLANGDLAVDVPVGGTVVIYNEDTTSPPFQVEALVGNITEYNYWGMH
jgi:alpha-L-fucosidase 2